MALSSKESSQVQHDVQDTDKYRTLDKRRVDAEVAAFFRRNPGTESAIVKPQSKKYKDLIRKIRAELHAIYGTFQASNKNKREHYLKSLQGVLEKGDIQSKEYFEVHDLLLSTSVSTRERKKAYLTLYENLFAMTGKPNTILDLGCGMNPLSYCYMYLDKVRYLAYDIDDRDKEFMNAYFALMRKHTGLDGTAQVLDLTPVLDEPSSISSLPKAEVCFLFKVLDPIERAQGHQISEALIKAIPAKWIIASFSTHTVSGKPMNHPYRGWIERMLERIALVYQKMIIDNEVFYIIRK